MVNEEKETAVTPVKLFIKRLLLEEDLSITKMADKLGTSRQNFNKKLENNSLRLSEALTIAELLGYELKFVKKQESKEA